MGMRNATLAFLIAVFAGVSPASGQDTTLRYQWVKGDEVRYRVSQQTSVTMSGLPGLGDMTLGMTMVQVVRMAVQDVAADGTATLRETFDSIRMEQNSPFGRTVFDSASPEKPADPGSVTLGTVMTTMVGESVTIVVGPNGAVTRVEGMSVLADKAVNALPPGPAAGVIAEQLKGFLSDESIRSMMGQNFVTFVDRPLKPGDTWTSQFEQANPLFGRVSATQTFTLSSVESRNGAVLAHIAVQVAMKQAGAATSPIGGLSIKFDDSQSTGEIVFDATKGRLQQASFTGETPADLLITPPGGEAIRLTGLTRNLMTMDIVEK